MIKKISLEEFNSGGLLTSYRNSNSSAKDHVRRLMRKHILDIPRNYLFGLTLPHANSRFENNLISRGLTLGKRVEILGCEKDKMAYKGLDRQSRLWEGYMQPMHTDVFELENWEFDFVWLDLCASYSRHSIPNILKFIEHNKLKKGGVFAVTLCKNRGYAKGKNPYELIKPEYKDYRNTGFQFHMLDVLPSAEVLDVVSYGSKERGLATTMQTFIFKIKQ